MTGLQLAALTGLLLATSVLCAVWWLTPTVPALGPALDRLTGAPTGPAFLAGAETQDRVGAWVARWLPRWVWMTPVKELALLRRTEANFYGEKLILAAIGLVAPPLRSTLFSWFGLRLPIAVPLAASLVGAGLIVLPNLDIHGKAKAARLEFNHVLTGFIDLVALERRAGSGPRQALENAARVGRGQWVFDRLTEGFTQSSVIQAPPPELIPVEKTVMTEGQAATPTLLAIDQALKLLAVSGENRVVPPQLVAVQLLPGEVAVQLVEPVTLAHPWRPDPADGRRWLLAAGAYEQEATARSAYPQLVSMGLDDDGATWLVNLEQLGTISLTGDPTYAADFARYLAAEIAVNPWARQVQLDCIGIAPEAVPLDPARIRHHRLEDPAPLDAAIAAAGATIDKCATHDVTAAAGRADDLGGDVWGSWLVLVNGALSSSPLDRLLALVGDHPARNGTAVVIVADTEPIRGLGVRLTGQGRVLIPSLGLDLIANGLTPAEAEGCALLLAHADLLDDVEMPSDGDDGWREYCDAAGAIRDELVLPRGTDPESEPGATVVPAPDAEVLDVAATTTNDLQQLAPHVPDKVRVAVEGSDPDLDADLAAWAAGTRPHLRLLGPIQARTGTTGKPTVVAKRKAFYTELLAFLALHPQGVTIDQVVDAFGSDATQMRVHLSKVRSWLGVDPTTGGNYLPDATKSPAGIARGMGIYQLVGVLADIDLFRRLRARGQARGPEGLSDLQAALALVTGEPFAGQRGRGWSWLADGVRVDQHMVCAVVDVAHTVAIAAMHSGDLELARTATETALLAAPYEDTPRLDLAAVVAAEGDRQAAERMLRDDVSNRVDNGDAPDDLPDRTAALVASAPWLKKGRVA